ncbi:MAG: 1-deoxy-D-xylulose-5-phosphate synthase [Rikenellaceae bacterium]|nr:1-deoxy-D-xylulose-5-phosphate synthase [Rikenellaceae bacterium]
MTEHDYKYLHQINSPADLKKLSPDELPAYCDELRHFIIDQLAANPGHLGSSLGVIELTVALHYLYDTPDDKLVWDVGHQAYAHKIITGRRDQFSTNRRLGGLSGFPRMSESPYDAFGTGHSSTSISAALGIAVASQLRGEGRKVVAVIGDGALTGGLAFEGLNNAGAANTDILVILNDNNMSIDKNVGAMKEYLLGISTSARYNRLKDRTWNVLGRMPSLRRFIQKVGNGLKHGFLQQSNLFEGLHFRYFGPVDGHDVRALTRVIGDLKRLPGPKLLHVVTVKGKGYAPAERDQALWHAPGRFNPETGELLSSVPEGCPPRFQDVFGHTVLELARRDPRIVGITPAMPTGCSLSIMMEAMPERCFDVGIAEGHAVTFAAGLAATGLVPFCNIYSSFMQRAYDNVIHDVAIQGLNVVMCLDRAGVVGEDGATHHGVFDIAALRPVPGLIISSPMDEPELRRLMMTATGGYGAFVIRYPRGRGVTPDWECPLEAVPVGRGRLLREGSDLAVISFGPVGNDAAAAIDRAAVDGISAAHVDLRFVKPLDAKLLRYVAERFDRIVTVEDGVVSGGMGSAVLEWMNAHGFTPRIEMLGVPDTFVEHGTPAQLRRLCGYDTDGILARIRAIAAE